MLDVFFGKGWRSIFWERALDIVSIPLWLWKVRAMLQPRGGSVFIFLELLYAVSWYQNVQCTCIVISLKFDSAIKVAIPVFGKFIILFEAAN
jgi:hypothetical protein